MKQVTVVTFSKPLRLGFFWFGWDMNNGTSSGVTSELREKQRVKHEKRWRKTSWWFQTFFIFTLTWGNDPTWLIFFKLKPPTRRWLAKNLRLFGWVEVVEMNVYELVVPDRSSDYERPIQKDLKTTHWGFYMSLRHLNISELYIIYINIRIYVFVCWCEVW